MAKTKRVQVLMDPEEFAIIEDLARKRRSSVADLMREAARVHLLGEVEGARRSSAAQTFLSLPETALPCWTDLKKEIEDRRG